MNMDIGTDGKWDMTEPVVWVKINPNEKYEN